MTTYKWEAGTNALVEIPDGLAGGSLEAHFFPNKESAQAWLIRVVRPGDFVSIGGTRIRI